MLGQPASACFCNVMFYYVLLVPVLENLCAPHASVFVRRALNGSFEEAAVLLILECVDMGAAAAARLAAQEVAQTLRQSWQEGCAAFFVSRLSAALSHIESY